MRIVLASVSVLAAASAASAQVPLRAPLETVFLPAEITDAAPAGMEGVLKRGEVIAQHTLRAREAVVLQDAVKARHREVPAGTPLALVLIEPSDAVVKGAAPWPTDPSERAWCDVRPTGRLTLGNIDCFQDADGDGRFERAFTGAPAVGYFGFNLARLTAHPAPVNAAYRPAAAAERPVTRVGYRYCGGDGVTAPPTFTSAASIHGDGWETGGIGDCRFGVWPEPQNKGLVSVDQLRLAVTPGPSGLAYRVENRIPAQPMARITPAEPLRAAADAVTRSEAVTGLLQQLIREPLKVTGAPSANGGVVNRGEALLSVPVAHGITGVLTTEVRKLGLFQRDTLPVGQPVYGIPMMGAGSGGIIWCAPRSSVDTQGRTRWGAVCLPKDALHRWVGGYPALFVRGLSWSAQNTNGATAPVVEEKPVDIAGPMTLSYRFVEWDEQDADVEVHLEARGERSQIGGISLKRQPDGTATLETLGGTLRLSPNGGDRRSARVEVVTPPQEGAPLKL